MTILSRAVLNCSKFPRWFMKRKFLDSLRIFVCGGAGGNGLPRIGGIGGKGGDVYIVGKEGMKLKDLMRKHSSKRFIATRGENSNANRILGNPGNDIHIEVPSGITAYDDYGRILGEIDSTGSKVLVAKGGPGGSFHTQFLGLAGQVCSINLDLKLIADVGLVGFPNAGKSSLLRVISKAKPKIASYPFTTIEPNIGMLAFQDYRQISMADLPGLIEGAHANIGMGHKFLKHAERTKLILMVADINGFRLGPQYPQRSALETIVLLHKELELYQEDLLKKPILLAVNKMDTPGAEEKWQTLQRKLENYSSVLTEFSDDIRPVEPIEFCHITNISVKSCNASILQLKDKIRDILDSQAERLSENEEIILRRRLERKMFESGPCLM